MELDMDMICKEITAYHACDGEPTQYNFDTEAGTTFGMGASMDRDPGRVAEDGSEALILGT